MRLVVWSGGVAVALLLLLASAYMRQFRLQQAWGIPVNRKEAAMRWGKPISR